MFLELYKKGKHGLVGAIIQINLVPMRRIKKIKCLVYFREWNNYQIHCGTLFTPQHTPIPVAVVHRVCLKYHFS